MTSIQQDDVDSFYIDNRDVYYFTYRTVWERLPFHRHPKRVKTPKEAKCIIMKILTIRDLQTIHTRIRDDMYYLILFRLNLDSQLHLLELPIFQLRNVLFFTFDLRDHCLRNDEIQPLRGVTIPSPYKFELTPERNTKRKYLVSFKGNCNQVGWFGCSNVRRKMKDMHIQTKNCEYEYLFEDTTDHGVSNSKLVYNEILLQSTYGLVLHGDGRWSHRFGLWPSN
jgi:hypothetical protein